MRKERQSVGEFGRSRATFQAADLFISGNQGKTLAFVRTTFQAAVRLLTRNVVSHAETPLLQRLAFGWAAFQAVLCLLLSIRSAVAQWARSIYGVDDKSSSDHDS